MKIRVLKAGTSVLFMTLLMTTTVSAASLSISYDGKDYNYSESQLAFNYKGKNISLGKTPGIQINHTNMLPYYISIVKNGPKVKRNYNSKTGQLDLTYGKKKITFYTGKTYAYTNGTKRTLTAAPRTVKYKTVNKSYIVIPAKFTAQYLGISYQYDSSKKMICYAKPTSASPISNPSKVTTYRMNMTRAAYIKKQKEVYNSYAGKTISSSTYDSYINPSSDQTGNFAFLTLDTYRDVNAANYKNTLENMISGRSTSVFKGKSDAFITAAKTYNIDPLYFLCQTVHESGYGTSTLAKGIKSSSLADVNVKKYDSRSLNGKIVTGASVVKDSSGEITGFRFLPASKRSSSKSYVKTASGYLEIKTLSASQQKKTCYNLYGIKAVDAAPQLCGFTYAYNEGWTSVDKAIAGAAKYISKWYVHNSTYQQNTLYRFRYNQNVSNIWHQYATDPAYAKGIGSLMNKYKNVYANGVSMTYNKPVYQ